MKGIRIYTGTDNESHFQEFEIALAAARLGRLSPPFRADGVVFRETGPSDSAGFHNAPRRQFVLTLQGSVEFECGDGSTRRLDPGGILFAEDTSGQGHISREVESPRITVFVPVDDDFDFAAWCSGGR